MKRIQLLRYGCVQRAPTPYPHSVTVHDFHIVDAFYSPLKTDSPLIADTNAVLACTLSAQCLQMI